ncbi:rRNA methyltransferase [Rossellomorea aquimaris]|uniref:rRNA methyltransferase n=1 Tax=Rossellomorea aquimaris TaxID=189382 RepID=UPI000697AE14|nr:rRNA methyltransferase [Rossellomorea aquimaris]
MKASKTFEADLKIYLERFDDAIQESSLMEEEAVALEELINEYSQFILNEEYIKRWDQVADPHLVDQLRNLSALSVAKMEKHRARKLLRGEEEIADYFRNIESSIEEEFGQFQVTGESTVLLVGSGSFPMTPLLIAGRTGAKVIGIDIDEEAVTLGRQVVNRLGRDLNIALELSFVEQLRDLKEVTHIIFSSTVEVKYDIMDQLYELTNEEVVVSMRYGDGLKSLFNFPSREVDKEKWRIAENSLRPQQIFDILLYEKIRPASSQEGKR